MANPARAYPVLSRACIAVGAAFLLLSAIGNWRFGWSLATEQIDQLWLAAVYAGSDVAAGVMVAAGAIMLHHMGWRRKLGGLVAMVPALALVSLSVMGTFGMMSGRIAITSGQQRAMQVDQDRLKWLRGQSINRENNKTDRRLLRMEERQAYKEARQAASQVTDPQATALANAAALVGLKLKEDTAQVAITFASSSMPMLIKFTCLWLGFFLWGVRRPETVQARKEPDQSSGQGGQGGGGGKGNVVPMTKPVGPVTSPMAILSKVSSEPASVVEALAPKRKLSQSEVYDQLRRQQAGIEPRRSMEQNAQAWGWNRRTIARYDKRLRDQTVKKMRSFAGNGGRGRFVPAYN